MSKIKKIVWMDLEMTGLDPENYRIMEIATLITDFNLEILARGPELIIRQDASDFAKMDDWNKTQHVKTGLWQQALASEISCRDAELKTLDFIKAHVDPRTAPLAGNTIWQDRRFLCRQMPELEAYLHYRVIDVTSIKQLAAAWYPDPYHYKIKKETHRALADIEESVEELKYYRAAFFKSPAALDIMPPKPTNAP